MRRAAGILAGFLRAGSLDGNVACSRASRDQFFGGLLSKEEDGRGMLCVQYAFGFGCVVRPTMPYPVAGSR